MSKKTFLMVAGISALCVGLVAGCTKKEKSPPKPGPAPVQPQVMRPGPDPGMRPVPARPGPAKVPKSLLGCELSAGKTFVAGKPVQVTWKLTNIAKTQVRVLGWQTPLDLAGGSLTAPALKVELNGKPVAYKGAKVKHGAPDAKDYVALAAGKGVVKVFDLAKSYDLSKPGKYTVSLARPIMDVVADAKIKVPRPLAQLKAMPLSAAKISFTVTAK